MNTQKKLGEKMMSVRERELEHVSQEGREGIKKAKNLREMVKSMIQDPSGVEKFLEQEYQNK